MAEVTDAPAVATPVDLSPCSRVLKAWEFQEVLFAVMVAERVWF